MLCMQNYFKRVIRDREKKWQYYLIALQQRMIVSPENVAEPVDPAFKAYLEERSDDEEEEDEGKEQAGEDANEGANGDAEGMVIDSGDSAIDGAIVKTEDGGQATNSDSTGKETEATGAKEAEQDVDVEESSLVYSTLEGVSMVEPPEALRGVLHDHQVRFFAIQSI